jgi:hypothetical protein
MHLLSLIQFLIPSRIEKEFISRSRVRCYVFLFIQKYATRFLSTDPTWREKLITIKSKNDRLKSDGRFLFDLFLECN